MRVLIVEDSPERVTFLKSLYRDHAWIEVRTVKRATLLLDAYDFDVISLDYDLAGEGKGDEVARYLVGSRNSNVDVIIHSDNAVGAGKIKTFLPKAVHVPTSKIIQSNERFKELRHELGKDPNTSWTEIFRDFLERR